MNFFRRLKTKYGIAHPLCMLSLLACLCLCAGILVHALAQYEFVAITNAEQMAQSASFEGIALFIEELSDTVIRSYSQTVAIGIEPFLAVIVQGIAGFMNAMLGMPFNINATWFSMPEILAIAFIVCIISKLMQCFECTRSFAMLTIGEFERIFGYLFMIYIACQNVTRVMYVFEKHKSILNALLGNTVVWITPLAIFVIGISTSFVGILVFYIIKTMVLGSQIMQLSISFFPFTSFLFEVLRSSVTIAVAVFNLLFPRVGFAFNCATLIIGCVLLVQTSNSVEYFRVVYIETLLLPYYRFKGKKALLYADVPGEIRKRCQNEEGIIIPVFFMERFKIANREIASHEKWWLEITLDKLIFYRKKLFSRKVESFSIKKSDKQWYFKDNWRCLELFDLNGPAENIIKLFQKPEREIGFVVSREYESIFADITESIGATDYSALKKLLTEERKNYIEQENKAFYAIMQ